MIYFLQEKESGKAMQIYKKTNYDRINLTAFDRVNAKKYDERNI